MAARGRIRSERRIRSQAIGRAIYPQLPGEAGPIYDLTKKWGSLARHCAGGVVRKDYDYENDGTTDRVKANGLLDNVEGSFPKQDMDFGLNWRPVFSGADYRSYGGRLSGIFHPIAGGTTATATATMSGGGVNSITVTGQGGSYARAPAIWAYSVNSGVPLRGFRAHAVMEASTIDMVCWGGKDHAPGDVLTGPGGVQVTVSTVAAGGVFLTGSITNRGSSTDPRSLMVAGRWVPTSTTGSGDVSDTYLLIDWRLKSGSNGIVIDSAGTLGGSSVTIYVEYPAIDNIQFNGRWRSAGRIGVQGDVDCFIEDFEGINDPDFAFDGNGQPGCHFDYGRGLRMNRVLMRDAKDRSGLAGWAALSANGSGVVQRQNSVIADVDVRQCDVNGIAVNCDLLILRPRVRSFGRTDTILSTRYFGPASTKAFGMLVYRALPSFGHTEIGQRDEGIGACASAHICVMSTSLNTGSTIPPNDPDDNTWQLKSYTMGAAHFDSIRLWNVSREGGLLCVSRDHADSSRACQVSVAGNIEVHKSGLTAMTSGYQLVQVNSSSVTDRRTLLRYGSMTFCDSTGTADCLFVGSAAHLSGGAITYPIHGSGKLGDFQGRHEIAAIRFDGNSNNNMANNGTTPLFTWEGAGVVACSIGVFDGDCQAANIAGKVMLFKNVGGGVNIRQFSLNHYRNQDIVSFEGTNNKVVLENGSMVGAGGTGNAFLFGGTLNDCHLINVDATAFNYAFKNNDTPATFNRCTATNVRGFSNTTNSTDLPSGSFTLIGTTVADAATGVEVP
jgi:hypothetical protein